MDADAPAPDLPDTGILKPAQLRGILRYVPMFRGQVFVIALDGHIAAEETVNTLMLDIAVLRSLAIKVVLVHGIGHQLAQLAASRGLTPSNLRGDGRVDEATLELAIEAAGQARHRLVSGLTRAGLRCVETNAVRATEVGVIAGEDRRFAGRVQKLDTALLERLLEADAVPLVTPIAYNREGQALRLNSDSLAAALALGLRASKLVYLAPADGLVLDGEKAVNLPVAELEQLLEKAPDRIDETTRGKAREVVQALRGGVGRAHILDGRQPGSLLNELFDQVGIGSMIHADAYQEIRPARKKDVQAIYDIVRNAARTETLRNRTRQQIEADIDNTFVYEIDGTIIATVTLTLFPEASVAEVGMVLVQPFYQKRGVGVNMVDFVAEQARARGATRLFALTTQAARFFQDSCHFTEARPEDLLPRRRDQLTASGRQSRVFVREL
ncbi:MAG: amino-acid N-acetyltransferase [Opitutales bacterium]